MTKRVNITLIHGTFAKNAAWTAETSSFRESIVDGLQIEATFERLAWSGRNSLPDRILAAEELAAMLLRQHSADPDGLQIVIGHSHGGGILAYALTRHPELAAHVSGVFLATPFIDARARRDWVAIARLTAVGFLTLFVVALTWAMFAYLSFFEASLFVVLAPMLSAQLLAMFIAFSTVPVRFLTSRFDPNALAKTISNCQLPNGAYLFVRTTGDEASSFLSVAQFSAWLFSRLISFLTGLLPPRLQQIFEGAFAVGSGFFGGGVWLLLYRVFVDGLPANFNYDYWNSQPRPEKLDNLLILLVLLGAALIVFFISIYFVLVSIFFLICWVGHRSFGRASFATAMFIELVVEPIPIGSHTLIHASWVDTDRGLSHSSPYQNPEAIALIREWIKKVVQS
jgi:hypothetical protein